MERPANQELLPTVGHEKGHEPLSAAAKDKGL